MAFGDNDAVAFGLDDDEEGAPKGASFNAPQSLKNAVGGVDAAVSMAAGIPAQIYGGLSGLGTGINSLLSGEGMAKAIDRAGTQVTRAQESNFGLGLPKPLTKAGKDVTEMVGDIGEKISDVAGEGGAAIGGEFGRANAKVAAGVLGAFLPIPGGKGVRALGKQIERPFQKKAAVPTEPLSTKDVIAQEKFAKEQPQGVLFGTEDGVISDTLPSKIVEDPSVIDQVKKQQAEELNTIVKDIETPKGEQLDLFEPEQRTIDFTFGKDDASIPKREDVLAREISMEEYLAEANKQIENNASGESAASLEAQSRLSQEKALDRGRYVIKSNGDVIPLIGVDAVDYFPKRGEVIVQKNVGKNLWTVLDSKNVDNPQRRVAAYMKEAETISLKQELDSPVREMELLPLEERPVLPDTIETPRSEATLAARAAEQRKANILRTIAPEAPLKEWLDVNTREEAMALSLADKDIGSGTIGRNLAAGIHGNTIMSGHPMLRYVRKLASDARASMARMSQEYITGQEGLVTAIQKLHDKERVAIMELLTEGDKQQFRATKATMEKLGFSNRQKAVVRAFQRAGDAELALWNKKRVEMGFKPIAAREGWLPGVFKGNYKTIVWDKDGNIVGMITQDTKMQQKAALAYYKKQFPGSTTGTMVHQGLGKSNKVDMFSGLNDVLAHLAKEDPKMAELVAASNHARTLVNNNLFSVGKHELHKKGISGNEGNKPWLNKEQNAKESLRSMVDYFESAFEHHELQPLLKEINSIVTDVNFPHENAKKYLQQYGNHISGKTGKIGEGVNHVLDSVFDAVGLGTNIPMKGLTAIKAGMSRYFMGWNPAFLASQLAQPFQMAFPLAGTFAKRLGLPQGAVADAMGRGAVWGAAENMAKWYDNPKLAIAPQYIKDAITYAHDRGLYAFNELELAHQATKSKTGRAFNAAADFTISTGDKMTKLPTYLGFVELFKDAGIDTNMAFALAEKATESSMVSYHPWERPMVYQKMGAVGQFAGGLTTYKHANMNLQAKLVQEAFGQQKNMKPLLASGAAMLLFAGITGLPAYGELDTLYGLVMEQLNGKPSSIREDFLQQLPEMVKSGAVSAASNLNMQAKWSSADMLPDTVAKAASPHLEGAYKIAEAAALYATDPSTVNRNNLLMALSPTGVKGFTENAFMKDEQGRVLDNKGLPKFNEPRSEGDWSKRKWSGVGLLSESIENTDLYKDRQAQAYTDKKIKDLAAKIKTAHIGSDFARSVKLLEEYNKLAGPEATQALIQTLGEKTLLEKNMGARQRLQGTPNNTQGVKKYENYNDGK